MIRYQVGNSQFTNKFLAYAESRKTGCLIKFNLHEEEFDAANWSKEPDRSFEQLMDIRAHQIAATKRPIVLGFSGGTDALTMYNVFKRNNIQLAALYLKYKDDPTEKSFYNKVIPFMEKEKVTQKFEILYGKETKKTLSKIYATENWAIETGLRVNFSVSSAMSELEDTISWPGWLDTNFQLVEGLEKPRIKFKNGKVYSYLQDTSFYNLTGERHVHFFISPQLPELHVKQSYMLANYLITEAIARKCNVEELNNIHESKGVDYLRYCLHGTGRHGDLANSQGQKVLHRGSYLLIPDKNIYNFEYQGRSETALRTGILNGEKYAINYINGLIGLKQDSIYGGLFNDKDNYYSVKDFESKHYEIKPILKGETHHDC